MKSLVTFFLLAATLMTTACKKETDAQLLAKRLEDIVRTQQVERVIYANGSVGDPSNWTIYGDWGKAYNFDPPFVTIETHVFNLASMKTFEIVTISNYKCMVLVF